MFDRYTERARRALFFARYETSQLGGQAITTEHLLLGVVREAHGLVGQLLRWDHGSDQALRKKVKHNISDTGKKVPPSVEIPFSNEVRRVLAAAAAEADGCGHAHIGTEHLLLGILRETSTAAGLLGRDELTADAVRTQVRQSSRPDDAD